MLHSRIGTSLIAMMIRFVDGLEDYRARLLSLVVGMIGGRPRRYASGQA
jgi:hypothetical protein